MDIQFAILGLLSWQPLSGYDLKKLIAESDVFYWSGNNNQIYNNLITLHKAGLVTQEVLVQESLPAKKIYSITEAGKQQLRSQLLADPELPELHNHFLIQIAWADLLSAEELDGLLAGYEAEINVQLRMRQERKAPGGDVPTRTPRESYLWRMILEHITTFYLDELEWVRKMREDLHLANDEGWKTGEYIHEDKD